MSCSRKGKKCREKNPLPSDYITQQEICSAVTVYAKVTRNPASECTYTLLRNINMQIGLPKTVWDHTVSHRDIFYVCKHKVIKLSQNRVDSVNASKLTALFALSFLLIAAFTQGQTRTQSRQQNLRCLPAGLSHQISGMRPL